MSDYPEYCMIFADGSGNEHAAFCNVDTLYHAATSPGLIDHRQLAKDGVGDIYAVRVSPVPSTTRAGINDNFPYWFLKKNRDIGTFCKDADGDLVAYPYIPDFSYTVVGESTTSQADARNICNASSVEFYQQPNNREVSHVYRTGPLNPEYDRTRRGYIDTWIDDEELYEIRYRMVSSLPNGWNIGGSSTTFGHIIYSQTRPTTGNDMLSWTVLGQTSGTFSYLTPSVSGTFSVPAGTFDRRSYYYISIIWDFDLTFAQSVTEAMYLRLYIDSIRFQ